MSLAFFMSETASVLSAPLPTTRSSCAESAAYLLEWEVNGCPVNPAIFLVASSANSGGAFMPVPTAVPPIAMAVPGAVAAKLAHPNRRVVAVTGDGGFLMNSQEFETAVRLETPFMVLVFNDRSYGLIS